MNIAVINLMRLGDLVQTSPVLRRLRAQYPESRVTLVVKDLFLETARLLPGLDRLLPFPSVVLAALLDQENGWVEALQRLSDWLRENFPQPPDVVINLTPSRMAGILAYATGAPDIRGMAVNRDRELVTQPQWASYALMVSQARQANPFNLVDLFLREGGLLPDGRGLEVALPREAEVEADNCLGGLNLPKGTALVGLVPGASRPERCWPPEQFARTALLLLKKRPCHFFIFGSAGEAPLGQSLAGLLPPAATTLLMGRTSPAVLGAYLKRLQVLITNDTGPMHLAAAVGTPTVALFLASARVQDTGPVGQGHVILEPRLDCHPCLAPCPQTPCHRAISPEAVFLWADKILSNEALAPGEDDQTHLCPRVYLSATDPQGYHAYLPLGRRPLGRRDFWLWLHRDVWGKELDGPDFSPAPLRAWLEKGLENWHLPPRQDLELKTGETYLLDLCRTAGRGEALAGEIARLAEQGQMLPGRVWSKVEALRSVDQGLRRIGAGFPELASLVEFFFQDQRGQDGTEAGLLARELQMSYTRLRRLGESALKFLADLGLTLAPEKGREHSLEMAQSVQSILVNRDVLTPESEELSCR